MEFVQCFSIVPRRFGSLGFCGPGVFFALQQLLPRFVVIKITAFFEGGQSLNLQLYRGWGERKKHPSRWNAVPTVRFSTCFLMPLGKSVIPPRAFGCVRPFTFMALSMPF